MRKISNNYQRKKNSKVGGNGRVKDHKDGDEVGFKTSTIKKRYIKYIKIAVAKENESTENPGMFDKRVILTPLDVKTLIDYGCEVYVEKSAGEGIGYSDSDYQSVGAQIQDRDLIYKNKELILKLKGPANSDIKRMTPGTTLMCMAHLDSLPGRAKLLKKYRITTIAMEKILESPEAKPYEYVMSELAVKSILETFKDPKSLDIVFLHWSRRLIGGIRYAARFCSKSLAIVDLYRFSEFKKVFSPDSTLLIYDSKSLNISTSKFSNLFNFEKNNYKVYNISIFEKKYCPSVVNRYYKSHPLKKFGKRRIEALHEAGQAGARYGLHLLRTISKKRKNPKDAIVVVLGYGNVAMGAVDECYTQGVKIIWILTHYTTREEQITKFIKNVDLIINGAEQPKELRGKNYLITNEHCRRVIPKNSVIIDLIGGSTTNRCAVEPILNCTYMDNPYFVKYGIYFSSLWGWPMMGVMKESAERYSSQVVDVLLGKEYLIGGLDQTTENVKNAVVCCPYI